MRLDGDVNQLLRRQCLESSKQVGYQGPERFESVRGRHENDDSNWESTEVLLMLQVLIRCQERVERATGQLQQFTVSLARPVHRSDGADFVLGQQPGKRPG